MGIKTFLLLCLTTCISGVVHRPKVYEDNVEHFHNINGNIRTIRNPHITYRTVLHEAPIFSFEAAKQQDHLKYRYAQQQRVDSFGTSKRHPKIQHILSQPIKISLSANQFYPRNHKLKKDANEWQPFSPQIQRLINLKAAKEMTTDRPNFEIEPSYKTKIKSEGVSSSESGDLDAQGSEIVEDKHEINRKDSPDAHGQIVYLNQNPIKQNSQQKIMENYESTNKKPDTHLRVLNELIGKNPNVQLEGLKRLLQETPTQNHLVPIVRGPHPFQIRDHTPISEAVVDIPNTQNRPNIQVNHADNSISPQISHIVNKESLADLQKQFDEASRIQTQQVLAKAQQEAQAHVEAQHKAIALAQVQAQNAVLENIQKSLYENTPTLPVVQQNLYTQTYAPHAQALVRYQPTPTHIPPVPTNKEIPYANQAQIQTMVEKQQLTTNLQQDTATNDHPPQASTHMQIVHLPSANTVPIASYNNVPLHEYGTKDLLYYAPNHHHHQDTVRTQTGNANSIPAQAHSSIISHAYRESLANHQTLESEQSQSSGEDNVITATHSLEQPEPTASTYQEIILETKPLEQKDDDDLDELQYAAKYAFGYRIKDMKEGNDFGHEERRNGKSAEGNYHVLLPDGRLQKVEYYADNSGYHAKVTYENVAHH